MLSGSYLRFTDCRRPRFAPNVSLTDWSASSYRPGKLKYSRSLENGLSARKTFLPHSMHAASSCGRSQLASIPMRYGAERSPKAVFCGGTRPKTPPSCQTSRVEWCDGLASLSLMRVSIASADNSLRYLDFQ